MQANVPHYHVKSASTLNEALSILAQNLNSPVHEQWKPIAGGTDLMVLFEAGKLPEGRYLNIRSLSELRGIEVKSDSIVIGSLSTYSEVKNHDALALEFPLLGLAAKETGAIAIQNRGTIGGNIANASPAADTPPVLLCYDAKLELISSSGARTIDYSQFHFGYKKCDLGPGEMISKIILPRSKNNLHHYYRKVGTRKAQAISKVCFAAVAMRDDKALISHIRIALGSVAATPLRALATERALIGSSKNDPQSLNNAIAALSQEITPIDDIRSSRDYRLDVSINLLKEFFERI